jgi:NAD+ synthase
VFSTDVLAIDRQAVADGIAETVRRQVLGDLRRRGAVVGISGGIDSSVVAALCVRALGPDRVLGLVMPERDSSGASQVLAVALAEQLGIDHVVEDIGPTLDALGCYRRQDEAIRMVFPDYGPGWGSKLTLPSILEGDQLNVTRLTVADPKGREQTSRMPPAAYLQLVAATNFKQRVRATVEYYHADRLNYAVAGTPNLLEYDQGFFVKQGDGAADFKPIAHLYKSQVFALAEFLGLPEAIRSRPPTTDTFSIAQTQDEFYFRLPYREMDLALWAFDHAVPAVEAGRVLGLTAEQVERVYRDIQAKRRVGRYLHAQPLLADDGPGD